MRAWTQHVAAHRVQSTVAQGKHPQSQLTGHCRLLCWPHGHSTTCLCSSGPKAVSLVMANNLHLEPKGIQTL